MVLLASYVFFFPICVEKALLRPWLTGHTKSPPRELPLIEGLGERPSMLALLVV